MDKYLAGCSPYVDVLNYDIDKRVLILQCVNNPDDFIPHTRVVFTRIRSYTEETIDDEFDDSSIDSVIGMHWVRDHTFCIRTEKKEIILDLECDPQSELIALKD